MATLIRSIRNESTSTLVLRVPGFDATSSISIAPSATVDLLPLVTLDEFQSLQAQLASMVAAGAISTQATVSSSTLVGIATTSPSLTSLTITNTTPSTDALVINNTTPSQGILCNGKIVGRRDNGSSLVVRGLQSPTEGVAVVSSYSGIFTDAGYSDTGTLDTRFLMGGNNEMDVELQSPHMLRLTGGANDTNDGSIRLSSVTNITLMARGANEANAPKYLVVDRVDHTIHADPLTNNSSDVTLSANTGSLYLNYGVTTGAIVLPTLTNTQRGALTPVKGMLIMNADTSLLNVYDGSAWKAVDVSAV
jgi:hypothetical protein